MRESKPFPLERDYTTLGSAMYRAAALVEDPRSAVVATTMLQFAVWVIVDSDTGIGMKIDDKHDYLSDALATLERAVQKAGLLANDLIADVKAAATHIENEKARVSWDKFIIAAAEAEAAKAALAPGSSFEPGEDFAATLAAAVVPAVTEPQLPFGGPEAPVQPDNNDAINRMLIETEGGRVGGDVVSPEPPTGDPTDPNSPAFQAAARRADHQPDDAVDEGRPERVVENRGLWKSSGPASAPRKSAVESWNAFVLAAATAQAGGAPATLDTKPYDLGP